MHKLNQKGIGSVAVVILILVVGVVGFAGWRVWGDRQTEINRNTEVTIPESSKATESGDTPDTQEEVVDASEGGKYLVISEWDVRFKLPEDLADDVEYGIEVSDSGEKETAWFEVGKIADLPGSNCKLAATTESGQSGKTGGIGAFIVRSKHKIPNTETAYYYSPATNINLNEHWFSGGRKRYSESCVNDDTKIQLTADIRGSLVYSFESLESL